MRLAKLTTSLLISAILALLMAACGGGGETLIQRADSFDGGALSNFGGADGADTDARQIAREIASGRNYDFTLTGFELVDGAAQSGAAGGTDYGTGTGTIAVADGIATVTLDIASTNPDLTNIELVGTFSAAEAAAAIANPGSTFVVVWQISFDTLAGTVNLTAEQTLNGTDFTAI